MRNRRGAIVVMAGVFIVAIMLMAAISVDASRIFAAKNELQTASDAAALAGALQLLEEPESFADTARRYAQRNFVEQQAVDSVEVEIEYGVWMPTERQFIAGAEPKDAVRVTTRHPLPLSLARVFGDSTVMVNASAIAWAAGPVMEPRCLKPLAVPYSRLLQILGYQPYENVYLTDEDVRRLREMPVSARKWHFHFGNLDKEDDQADSKWGQDHYKRDQYFPIDIDSTWDRDDPNMYTRPSLDTATYRSYLAGPPDGRCTAKVRQLDQVRSEPRPKINPVRNGLAEICQSLGGTLTLGSTLTCRSPTGQRMEMPLPVAYWSGYLPNPDYVPWYNQGAGAILVTRMTGSFVVDSLDWDPGSTTYHARMHGYFDVQRDFGVVDETATSTLLRPVLVR
ncbi:MAG TPA: TadG family pilus assembly protein [Gemmatimonadaceae bacterium]|nr:TadG family pilus assembly protein [Gemmatimonadaceae bacterium]